MKFEKKSKFLEEIGILNLWGKEELTLPFKNQVTFLTGMNGSGKSSLLNVIFDSLICDPKKFLKPSTSKNRFWASRASFRSGLSLETLILPNIGKDVAGSPEVQSLLEDDIYDLEVIRKVQDLFEETASESVITYINHDESLRGEWWRKHLTGSLDEDELKSIYDETFKNSPPLAFLFQEDRTTLHNMENCSVDRTSFYWGMYRSSIDERFAYCRDAIQVKESHLNKQMVQEMSKLDGEFTFEDLLKNPGFKDAARDQKEIRKVISLLDGYFLESNKCIVRDEENKITLGCMDSNGNSDNEPQPISWELLSRGEKTLIYLFLAVYYYKDKTSLFLLDEPEISFHVSWQKRLIRDLTKVAPNNQFIVATHSPSLVMDGWMPNCLELKA